jgi:hypothetical protein
MNEGVRATVDVRVQYGCDNTQAYYAATDTCATPSVTSSTRSSMSFVICNNNNVQLMEKSAGRCECSSQFNPEAKE